MTRQSRQAAPSPASDERDLYERQEAALQTHQSVIADLERDAEERHRVIEELTEANRGLHEICAERLALIEEQHRTILELQADLQAASVFPGVARRERDMQSQIDELSATNAQLQSVCDERAALLESQSQSVAVWTEECLQRDAEIARLHRTALERLSVIEALNQALERLPG
jgi:uncharacterized protein YhaN